MPWFYRSSVFFILAAAALLGQVLATPMSAFLMSWTPWCPSMMGVFCEICGFVAAIAVSETRRGSKSLPQRSDNDIRDATDNVSLEVNKQRNSWRSIWAKVKHQTTFVRTSANISCIVATLLMATVGTPPLPLMIQYASNRFSWSIARSSFIIALKGIINLVSLLILLPKLFLIFDKHMSPVMKDFRIAQGSVCILALGSILMAFAPHTTLFFTGVCFSALGCGFYLALRSLATALVAPSQVGILNTSIALAQSIGAIIAGPTMASAFQRGIALGGVWLGLPYMVGAALFISASCFICGICIPSTTKKIDGQLQT